MITFILSNPLLWVIGIPLGITLIILAEKVEDKQLKDLIGALGMLTTVASIICLAMCFIVDINANGYLFSPFKND